ncbi:cytochrome c1 [Kiloniella sp. b19]|uniref:cytochrome c1 n=1 Tax=Kiloniella sp. GXU_MW_B19 TaxID=3141326 RepID=UPI0031D23029
MKKVIAGLFAAALSFAAPQTATAAGSAIELPSYEWSFEGVFGSYDKASLQRGFQVYQGVCASCHSLDYISFRNLADLGFSEDEIKAIAVDYTVQDGPNDDGEMFDRAGLPSDAFPAPFSNAKEAAASNGGKAPPDLSLMAKARVGGPNYIKALLVGYEEAPSGFDVGQGNYNKYFPGHVIAMANPLFDDAVEYADGTPATVEQMAGDVSNFLMWTAEPKLEDRKGTGVFVMIFLIFFTLIMYAAKRKAWADVH